MSGPLTVVEPLDPLIPIRVVERRPPEIVSVWEDVCRDGWVIRYDDRTERFLDRYALTQEDREMIRAFRFEAAMGRPSPTSKYLAATAVRRPELIARVVADPEPAKPTPKPKQDRLADLWDKIDKRLKDASNDREERHRVKRRGTRVIGDYGCGGGAARPRLRRLAKAA